MQLLSSDIESLAAMALADVADARLLMAVIETDTQSCTEEAVNTNSPDTLYHEP